VDLGEWSPYAQLGMTPASQQGQHSPAGETLPHSSHTGMDKGALPWHPDSPAFWGVLILGGTLLGMVGASFKVRVLKGSAGANVGKA
jgi:hypothetical protein